MNQSLLSYVGKSKVHSIIRTTEPISQVSTSFYFEALVVNSGQNELIGIGITEADPNTRSGVMPGWKTYPTLGIGYHGDDGGIFYKNSLAVHRIRTELFTTGDVVGCLVNRIFIWDVQVFVNVTFTKNGKKLLSPITVKDAVWYPTIGMASPGAIVKTNFGEHDFRYSKAGKNFI